MSEISQKTIYELLDKNYFIPSYQRGYRWGKRQIHDLLDDLFKFINSEKTQDSFYCLQPVVVKECSEQTKSLNNLQSPLDQNRWYEVIDGQQRLTTIYLLLKFLVKTEDFKNEYNTNLFKINYQTRQNDVRFIDQPEKLNDSSPNAYYITQGYKFIEEWFRSFDGKENRPNMGAVKRQFETLLFASRSIAGNFKNQNGTVQVIWYQTEGADPIKTFTRLNIGKIPLNNAELIKALFLQKRDNSELSELLQIQIAQEWDQMEFKLQDSNFWAFLNQNLIDQPSHIEFIFQTMFEVLGKEEKAQIGDKAFDEKYGTDEYASFRFFSARFENADRTTIKKEWALVDEYFQTFLEWYNNPLWYHYIGFLIYCGTKIIDIYDVYKQQTKLEFKNNLIGLIKKHFKLTIVDYGGNCEITNLKGDPITYSNSNKSTLRELLLLYNIEYILQKNKNNKSSDKGFVLFPFDLFKSEKWDIEHIDSFTTNPLTETDEQRNWLIFTLEDLEYFNQKSKISQEDQEKIQSFLNDSNTLVEFDDIRQIISNAVGEEDENDKDIKNSLGNLTLLNAEINRGYGNTIFPSKKKVIIKKDAEGKFIPLCTKNVFLKNFVNSSNVSISWKKEDMELYNKNIISVLEKFLTKKSKEELTK